MECLKKILQGIAMNRSIKIDGYESAVVFMDEDGRDPAELLKEGLAEYAPSIWRSGFVKACRERIPLLERLFPSMHTREAGIDAAKFGIRMGEDPQAMIDRVKDLEPNAYLTGYIEEAQRAIDNKIDLEFTISLNSRVHLNPDFTTATMSPDADEVDILIATAKRVQALPEYESLGKLGKGTLFHKEAEKALKAHRGE